MPTTPAKQYSVNEGKKPKFRKCENISNLLCRVTYKSCVPCFVFQDAEFLIFLMSTVVLDLKFIISQLM